ncbi:hypothetical protein SAMN05414137_10579 [Streptacidiphilus jiangxiensis]|uniref:DUF1508 domain-containing protein n=2 Tax=Streptacidiphilus jiangxiensis TaxID=235985 RepID=A0A1H7LXE4_STRJI|nr:hypothetical protein SAMN05414137_10579 [Streptacidiphilus jiangxiensis]
MPRVVTVRGTGAQMTWTLLAANGRPLATSAHLFAGAEELAAALRELHADRRELRFGLMQPPSGRAWHWTAYLPARRSDSQQRQAVARSARGYLRMDQCRRGAEGFTAALELVNIAWPTGT